ncbi:MAG: hypothetical protein J6O51_07075 [Bacteroidales bacterium]|nr:hypothetical protein [Bacteroidales bacterium]
MKDYYVILSVSAKGGQLNHVPLVQYWRIRYEIASSAVKQLTLTMPCKDREGTVHPSAPIQMNIKSFYDGNGFSNADINRWLHQMKWESGTLLLFKVSFKKNHLDYRLVGRVDKHY